MTDGEHAAYGDCRCNGCEHARVRIVATAIQQAVDEAVQAERETIWRDLQGITMGRPTNATAAARQAGHGDAIALVKERMDCLTAKESEGRANEHGSYTGGREYLPDLSDVLGPDESEGSDEQA